MNYKKVTLAAALLLAMAAAFIALAQPDIGSVNDAPDPIEVPGGNNITATITNADEAYVEIYYPNATLMGNYSMTPNPYNPWYYEGTYAHPDPLGTYTYMVTTRNATGWNASAVYAFTLEDTTPPSSSVDSLSGYWYGGSATLTATVIDNYAVDRVDLLYRYSSDNASWTSWTSYSTDTASPWQWSFDFPSGEGYYEFAARAQDVAVNIEAAPSTADEQAALDVTPPGITNIQASPASQTEGQHVNISCTSTDNGSGVATLYLDVEFPDTSHANLTMDSVAPDTYYRNESYSATGTYTYTIYAVDMVGNGVIAAEESFDITSITVPETVATFNPSEPDGTNGWYLGTVEVTLTASDPDGINYTKYRVGNTAWQTYTGPFNVSGEGVNVIEFYSEDNEGNIEDTKSTTVKIDTEAPTVSLLRPQFGYLYLFDRQLIPLSGGRTVSFGRLTVVASALDDASGIGNVTFYVNDEAQNIDLQSPYQWVWSSDIGTRALHMVAADRAGHTDTSGTIIVSIFSF